ncbi:hypothetical protein DDB_G0268418 [Dictyostelium discoideum AX4]|uniref:Uncharacterized protein n=1 Tax=Dictyostelium discoideum TaxID=44689 RepID=Q55FP5_DICDI|nr:hypothetical protein DDB_G0268418 [Dictyostelium discoideum AX4]EAL73662.1 hypothetical protein DDB_G0268418 [Dictyostelium discoideum AX4]|eukprot:XP_647488.1 hypothetical protein DDB_G0268418 [Dictyostelium discoideum AX4]
MKLCYQYFLSLISRNNDADRKSNNNDRIIIEKKFNSKHIEHLKLNKTAIYFFNN